MANVAHSTLTGSDLHEPKGIASATSGQIYVANGSGSGTWSSASLALGFTGQIADFCTPSVPTGWLECDGSNVSRTTYASLFTAVTIQRTGSRTNGSAVITSLSSTTDMKVGYFVGGTGIPNGTTILSVNSSTQITLSANATSTGSGTVIVSPFALGDGSTTFTLPDLKTSGRYRRSRTSSIEIGVTQTSQNLTHTHTGTTASNGAHTHTVDIPSGQGSHTHTGTVTAAQIASSGSAGAGNLLTINGTPALSINSATLPALTGTANSNGAHTHTFTTDSSGSSEARPLTLVVLTCIKT